MYPTALCGHEVGASLRVFYNVLGSVDEDVEGVVDVQSEIRAQTKTHRQTVVAVDDANTGNNIGVHGSLDAQRSSAGRTRRGDGDETEILAVSERLVGLLSGGWYVIMRVRRRIIRAGLGFLDSERSKPIIINTYFFLDAFRNYWADLFEIFWCR